MSSIGARTVVITGGTDGIGRALALASLRRGDDVVIIGRDAEKSKPALDCGATFVRADLSLVSENRRVVDEIRTRFPAVDALVLCARHILTSRTETAEGFEHNFALFYLSRYLFSHGLLGPLENADRPVIMNVAGPGAELAAIRWHDLQLREHYDLGAALVQGGKLNDLLGVAFADQHRAVRTRYVLFHPGMTATGFSGEYGDDGPTVAHIENMRRNGRSVRESIVPIIDRIDAPPAEPLSAFVEGRRITVDQESFDRAAALRLAEHTRTLLSR